MSSGIDHDNDAGANVAGDSSGSLGNDAAGNDRAKTRRRSASGSEAHVAVVGGGAQAARGAPGRRSARRDGVGPAPPRVLESYRNSVPVLGTGATSGSTCGNEDREPPWKLPEFIGATGIEKIRQTIIEQEAAQSAKQKGCGRVAPKMGRLTSTTRSCTTPSSNSSGSLR